MEFESTTAPISAGPNIQARRADVVKGRVHTISDLHKAELAKLAIPKTLQLDNQRGAPCQWVQEAEHALLYHVTMLPPCSPSSTMHPAKLIGS